jgi:ADP-ribose pyrophosphatase
MSGADWTILRQDVLLETPHLQVFRETLRTPSSPDGREWLRVARKAGVTVAPMLPDGAFVLIREERVPARRDFWQFPAGQVDDDSSMQAVEQAALRELAEEAGCEAPNGLKYLGVFFTSPGFTDEHTHQFLAGDVRWDPRAAAHDDEEVILEASAFTGEEVRAMVANNVIRDANTLALYARLAAGGHLR